MLLDYQKYQIGFIIISHTKTNLPAWLITTMITIIKKMDKHLTWSYTLSISTSRSEWSFSIVVFIQFKITASIFMEPSVILLNSWSRSLMEINFPKFNIKSWFSQRLNIRCSPCLTMSFWRSSMDSVCTKLLRISSEVLQNKIWINKFTNHENITYQYYWCF